ncbi:C39 family peptidase [Methanothermobacter wolfeii]|uniref:C39 family peptidase n=1 Tax=Methanothermobacter wolfeii TaxID=145261 RepID=A0A9E7ULS7_METWO|nr:MULTISPECIES: C39 family peptidase [Methanothermobacter]MDI6701764.1 C39 family peptidase [Methanothermobacter wolfeii]MDI6841209.1 C39 family peptidase [Methanothermobacter wolfeii]NLM01974.1 C39 family peptidase [Methanothermobacter wolfeii]QHN07135.1 C39 family peptidase [Methanothermobacter sp. THM-1]UXH31745.1 C39 family peptidase [Methanothermobacter wolfeii]
MTSSASGDPIVMQSRDYTCGPAALATVLKSLGIPCSESELAELAGTDESGTTMYGLIVAAITKGLKARGLKMDVSQLRKNHIVFVRFGESCHYSVIRSVNGRTVTLADPSLGEIKMKREIFSRIFTGNVLVVERPDD